MSQTMSERFRELIAGASADIDRIDTSNMDEVLKLRAKLNVHDRYLATGISEIARRLDALESSK